MPIKRNPNGTLDMGEEDPLKRPTVFTANLGSGEYKVSNAGDKITYSRPEQFQEQTSVYIAPEHLQAAVNAARDGINFTWSIYDQHGHPNQGNAMVVRELLQA